MRKVGSTADILRAKRERMLSSVGNAPALTDERRNQFIGVDKTAALIRRAKAKIGYDEADKNAEPVEVKYVVKVRR